MTKMLAAKRLRDVAAAIETNTCEINDEQLEEIAKVLGHTPMSKEQACDYLRISRSTFDTKIRNGELPKGRKRSGFKELVWYKDELT